MLEPRFRRIITIEDPRGGTQRSLRSEIADVPKKMTSDICKRKILRIEDDEHSLHPKFCKYIIQEVCTLIFKNFGIF